jgi:putative ABC transport system substrate-binding protein
MRRLLVPLLVAFLAVPFAAEAQQAGKVYRVGLITYGVPLSEMAGPQPSHLVRAFMQGLRSLGYAEGQNLILERRSGEGRVERFADIVAELVHLRPDVIVVTTNSMAKQAKAVTTTVPIVMATSWDPVRVGIVQSLARPGGNITGLTLVVDPEIEAKRLELLKQMLPRLSRVAFLADRENNDWERPLGQSVRAAAQALGVTLVLAEFSPHQYTDAFARIRSARAEALYVTTSPTANTDRAQIVDLVTRAQLPRIFAFREAVELGGLMSYGANVADSFRRAAGYVDKILRGAKPADLPIDQPTKFAIIGGLTVAVEVLQQRGGRARCSAARRPRGWSGMTSCSRRSRRCQCPGSHAQCARTRSWDSARRTSRPPRWRCDGKTKTATVTLGTRPS